MDITKFMPVKVWLKEKPMKDSTEHILIFDVEDWNAFLQNKVDLHPYYSSKGIVKGFATRKSLRKLNLISRAAHIFVLNSKGELFLQKRASTKDIFPNLIAPSASGHTDIGEIPQQTAQRELKEELEITGTPNFLGSIKCFTPQLKEFLDVFVLVTDELIKINEKEISEGYFVPLEEVYAKKIFSECVPAMQKELKKFKTKLKRFTK